MRTHPFRRIVGIPAMCPESRWATLPLSYLFTMNKSLPVDKDFCGQGTQTEAAVSLPEDGRAK